MPRGRGLDDGQEQALAVDIARGEQQVEAVDALEQRFEIRLEYVEGNAFGSFERLARA